jgi:hypothetical protein
MARQQAQFFLDAEQYQQVARLAETRDRPIPEVVHDLVDLGLERLKRRTQDRRTALQELTNLRRSIEQRQGTFSDDPIAEARAEREKQMNAVLSPVNKL